MSEAALVCANHPDRETTLRCNRCGRPICSQCAIRTPVGYRCPQCVKGQQRVFDTAFRRDYAIAAAVSAVGAGIGIGILSFLGIFGLLLAPVLGGGLAEIIRWAIGRRRSRRLPLVAAIGVGLGAIPHVLRPLLLVVLVMSGGGAGPLAGAAFGVLWPVLYSALTVSAVYYRLGGIQLG